MKDEEFIDFYKNNYNIIVGYVYKRVVKWEDVEDIVSDSFIALWESKDNLKEENIKNYLYGVVRNKIADYLRRKYKIEIKSISFDEYEDIIKKEEESYKSKDYTNLIMRLTKDLKEREKKLINLKYIDKKSFREISEELNITINNTKVLHNRIIKKLKIQWNKNL